MTVEEVEEYLEFACDCTERMGYTEPDGMPIMLNVLRAAVAWRDRDDGDNNMWELNKAIDAFVDSASPTD